MSGREPTPGRIAVVTGDITIAEVSGFVAQTGRIDRVLMAAFDDETHATIGAGRHRRAEDTRR